MCCIEAFKNLRRTILAIGFGLLLGTTAQADIIISEVASWSSGNSPLGVDWFELTNTGLSAVNITGWTVDDSSNDPVASDRDLTGIAQIAAGESVIFMETADLAAKSAEFKTQWFGGSPPAGLQIGAYTGGGIGLSTGGDELYIYNTSSVIQAAVGFGTAPAAAPFTTFDNKFGLNGTGSPPPLITSFSAAGVRGAFTALNSANEIGSPGTFTQVPEPTSAMLLVAGAAAVLGLGKRRGVR